MYYHYYYYYHIYIYIYIHILMLDFPIYCMSQRSSMHQLYVYDQLSINYQLYIFLFIISFCCFMLLFSYLSSSMNIIYLLYFLCIYLLFIYYFYMCIYICITQDEEMQAHLKRDQVFRDIEDLGDINIIILLNIQFNTFELY